MGLVPSEETAGPFEDPDRPVIAVVGPTDLSVIVKVAVRIRELLAVGARHLVVDVSAAQDVRGELLTVLAHTRAQLTAPAGCGEPAGTLRVLGVDLLQFLTALEGASPDEVFIVFDAVRLDHPHGLPVVVSPAVRSTGLHREVTITSRPGSVTPSA